MCGRTCFAGVSYDTVQCHWLGICHMILRINGVWYGMEWCGAIWWSSFLIKSYHIISYQIRLGDNSHMAGPGPGLLGTHNKNNLFPHSVFELLKWAVCLTERWSTYKQLYSNNFTYLILSYFILSYLV